MPNFTIIVVLDLLATLLLPASLPNLSCGKAKHQPNMTLLFLANTSG
jgi:hypothetical protein